MTQNQYYIGVDIQSARDCPYVVLDSSSCLLQSGWIPTSDLMVEDIKDICKKYSDAKIGLDCPRKPLPLPRNWYWVRGNWVARTNQVGSGRHCEVIIKANNIANPQWTPLIDTAPDWMRIGFRMFEEFQKYNEVYEVFPSASYFLLEKTPEVKATLSFEHFKPGPKDMLDAAIAAVTVKEFNERRGVEVGGGDGLGTIILPRPIPNPKAGVSVWPD
jgi:predicted nuclease with RNAse H fold